MKSINFDEIKQEKFNELFELWIDTQHKEFVKSYGKVMADAFKPTFLAMKDANKNFFYEGFEEARKVIFLKDNDS